jgi:hypothetical protein
MAGTTTKSKRTALPGSDANDLIIQHNAVVTDRNSRAITVSTPVIKAGGSAVAKTGAADSYFLIGGLIYKLAASTDLPALTGINLTAAYFNVVIFATDGTTVTAHAGTEASTLGAVVMPSVTAGKLAFAGLIITYASAFTGGTTALDTATTVYFSLLGGWPGGETAAKVGNEAGTAVA